MMEFKEALQRARNIKVALDNMSVVSKVVQSKDITARQAALQGVYKFEIELKSASHINITICGNAVRKHGGELEGTIIEQPHNKKIIIPFKLGVASL